MAERRFDDKEVGEILKIAAEMQSGLAQSGSSEGMTLSELERVAEEVGIKPEIIGRAVTELSSTPQPKSGSISDSVLLQRTVPGELTDDVWEELVTELRRTTGKAGKVETKGQIREWTANSDTSSLFFSATARHGQTRLRVLGAASGFTAMMIAFGLAFGILITLIPLIIVAKRHLAVNPFITVLLTILVGGFCVATTAGIIRANRKKLALEMDALLANLSGIAEAGYQPDQLVVGATSVEPLNHNETSKEKNSDTAFLRG